MSFCQRTLQGEGNNANAGQYATLNCKPLLFWFPCK